MGELADDAYDQGLDDFLEEMGNEEYEFQHRAPRGYTYKPRRQPEDEDEESPF